MDKNQGPFSWLNKLLNKEGENQKKFGKYQNMIVVLCIGAAFMLVSNLVFKNNSDNQAVPTSGNVKQTSSDVPAFGSNKSSGNKQINDYEKMYESQLRKALQEMLGVNNVSVVVNLDSTDQQVLEKNTSTKSQTTNETDKQGGERSITDSSTDQQLVIVKNGDNEEPIVVETKKPDIRGVLVVAKGADNIQVKAWIVEAVTRVLGVPSFKVAVMPKK